MLHMNIDQWLNSNWLICTTLQQGNCCWMKAREESVLFLHTVSKNLFQSIGTFHEIRGHELPLKLQMLLKTNILCIFLNAFRLQCRFSQIERWVRRFLNEFNGLFLHPLGKEQLIKSTIYVQNFNWQRTSFVFVQYPLMQLQHDEAFKV